MKIEIKRMTLKDLDEVYKIEEDSYVHPWNRLEFVKEIKSNKYAHYFVFLLDNKIIGFLGMWIIFEEAHITNIAISPSQRRKGYGSILIDFAESFARMNNTKRIVLEVRISNKEAFNLYLNKGFKIVSTKKNYYIANFEDAYEMIKVLI